jgi:hypothetical protein
MAYESPELVELGSVAEFTRADHFAFDFDGRFLRGNSTQKPPTS